MYNTNPSSVNLQIVNILTADVSVGPIIFFFWGWLARYRKRVLYLWPLTWILGPVGGVCRGRPSTA